MLNFVFPNDEYPADSYRHEIKLKDVEDNHVFYDKLTFVYLEIPKFNKREDELVTMLDKWMFAIRNLAGLLDRPLALQDRVFTKLFEQAEIAKYNPAERRMYEESRKEYWDYTSTLQTAEKKGFVEGMEKGIEKGMAKGIEKGMAKGRAEGLAEGQRKANEDMARKLKAMGVLSVGQIAEATGLSADEVEKLGV